MNRKIYLYTIIVVLLILCGCKSEKKTDSKPSQACDLVEECGDENNIVQGSLKEKYESLNGKTNKSGVEYRTVIVSADIEYIETDLKTIISMIEQKQTFYLYAGDEMCPWCRSVIEMAETVAKENGIDQMYSIEIWDNEMNEVFRDKYKYENGVLEKTVEADPLYIKLLELFDEFLDDYTLEDENDNEIEVGEKRIYAPNYFYVENGVLKRFATGISPLQEESGEELSPEILKDERMIFTEFFEG
ncbi:MAG: hypothetical protein IK151_03250 [Erysipelotrichaceae bacterium]|nr:hypothetical protein [Erysipelotrichaceae bacterium]